MTNKSQFRSEMIVDAQKAATAIKTSTIAKQLKANGFTTATMVQAASDLTDLHAAAEAARSAWLTASAALQTKAQEFELTWSSYCNIVRGVTSNATKGPIGVASSQPAAPCMTHARVIAMPATAPAISSAAAAS